LISVKCLLENLPVGSGSNDLTGYTGMATGGVASLLFAFGTLSALIFHYVFCILQMSWKLSYEIVGGRSFVNISSAFFSFCCMSRGTNQINFNHYKQCTLWAFVLIHLSCVTQFSFYLNVYCLACIHLSCPSIGCHVFVSV
jgi:hypothetical protein